MRDDRLAAARPVTPPDDPAPVVVAPAWLLRDVTHVPGVLILDGARCRFVSTRRVVFDATPDELALATSLTRRGRFRLTVDGERIGLSVVRPAGAVPVPAELLARASGTAGRPTPEHPTAEHPAAERPVADGPSDDDAEVAERWERLLVADAPGHLLPGPVTRARLVGGARRWGADRLHGPRRPRAWRAVTAFVPRLPLVGGRPRRGERPTSPMATV